MKVALKNDKINIELDYDEAGTVSKSGKSLIHATTGGNTNVRLPNGQMVAIGVNVYSKNTGAETTS